MDKLHLVPIRNILQADNTGLALETVVRPPQSKACEWKSGHNSWPAGAEMRPVPASLAASGILGFVALCRIENMATLGT